MNRAEQILNLLSGCTFGSEFVSEDIDTKVLSHLPEDFQYDWNEGASKLVIIPENEDYVIKIPYTGQMHEAYDEDDEECDYYDEFCNATGVTDFCWDYCLAETMIWRAAKAAHVERAFAKEQLIGMINGHPIYVQEKVDIYSQSDKYDSASVESKRKTERYCSSKNIRVFPDEGLSWQADALEYYGAKQFNKIMSFIQRNNIGDLHDSNIGYIGNKPVFADYSDFYD